MTFNNKGWKHKNKVVISTKDLEKAKKIFFKNGGKIKKLDDQVTSPLNYVNSKLGDSHHRSSEMTITLP